MVMYITILFIDIIYLFILFYNYYSLAFIDLFCFVLFYFILLINEVLRDINLIVITIHNIHLNQTQLKNFSNRQHFYHVLCN